MTVEELLICTQGWVDVAAARPLERIEGRGELH